MKKIIKWLKGLYNKYIKMLCEVEKENKNNGFGNGFK